MATDITTIKNWFKTGLKPTQAQFWATWDSYWHKDESISISNIENLEKVLDNKADNTHEHTQYATNDATSLTEANIISWQKTLKISDLKFDDKEITITQDYSDFGLQAGATINAFNNAIYQAVGNKLDAPVEEGTTTDYPYVVGVNEDNESTKLPADDLGKNFANTDLNISENRVHSGAGSVELKVPINLSSSYVKFTGLLDSTSDNRYNRLAVFNPNNQLGFVTQSANVIESTLTGTTATQGLRILKLLGYTVPVLQPITGTTQRYLTMKTDGTLDANIPTVGTPAKIMGLDADNKPVTAETIEFESENLNITSALSNAQLNEAYPDVIIGFQLICPYIGIIYKKSGRVKNDQYIWYKINIDENV